MRGLIGSISGAIVGTIQGSANIVGSGANLASNWLEDEAEVQSAVRTWRVAERIKTAAINHAEYEDKLVSKYSEPVLSRANELINELAEAKDKSKK